jgi:Spy/CpxP family protein refolding chaperone
MRAILGTVPILLAGLITTSTPSAYAQGRGPGAGPAARAPAAKTAPSAAPARPALPPVPGLTTKQREQIEALRVATFDQVSPLERDLLVKRNELQNLWSAAQPNREAILKKQAEMDATRQRIREAYVDEHLAILKILTPAQRAAMPSPGLGFGMGGCMGGGWGAGIGPKGGWGRGRGMGRGMGRGGGWWGY